MGLACGTQRPYPKPSYHKPLGMWVTPPSKTQPPSGHRFTEWSWDLSAELVLECWRPMTKCYYQNWWVLHINCRCILAKRGEKIESCAQCHQRNFTITPPSVHRHDECHAEGRWRGVGINKGLVHHTQKLSEEAWADGVLNILTRDLCVVFYLYVKKVICDRGVIIVPFENKTDKQTKKQEI